MSEQDRLRYLEEMQRHESQISSLARTLVDLDRCLQAAARARDEAQRGLARHIAFVNAQVMRHKISIALLQSRLA